MPHHTTTNTPHLRPITPPRPTSYLAQIMGPMVNLEVLLSAYPYVMDIPQGIERMINMLSQ